MKLSNLSLMSAILFATVFLVGCGAPKAPAEPTEPTADVAPSEEPTPTEPTAGTGTNSGDVAPATGAVAATTKQVNVETSTLKWNAKKVGGAHYGTVKLANGSLDFDATSKLIGGTFTIDMTTITVDDLQGDMQAGLLTHLKGEDFFAVDANPTSTLTITTVKELAPNSYEVTADLSIKGIINPVTFVASVDPATMAVTAPISLDRTLWDIKFRSLKFFSDVADKAIDDTVTYEVTLNLQ